MRLLILNSEYPPVGGGAGNASANLARTLANKGVEVTVLTSQFANLPQEETISKVKIVRVPAVRRSQDRSNAFEQLSFIFSGFIKSLGIVKSNRPDIILAFFGVPSGAIALGIKILVGIPYIVSLRGGDVPGFRPYDFALYHRLIGPLLHVVWRGAIYVVANSQGLRELGLAFDQNILIKIIPNGVDAAQYSSGKRAWNPPRMLIVGRIVYQKGIDILLDALSTLKDFNWSLTIIGDGPMRSSLETFSERMKIADRVHFLGWKEKEELIPEYHKANLFVLPSRNEGMPNVVLEAMASGLPVIASRIAGNDELVISGGTGILVPPEDPNALKGALAELLLDAALREQMGNAAQMKVKKNYTWEIMADQYLQLFESALEKV